MDANTPDAAELARAMAALTPATPDEEVRALLQHVDQLFASHQDIVYATCLRYVGSPEPARELAQDTLLKAYQKLPAFRGDARFSTWLVAMARFECLNALRKHGDQLTVDGVIAGTDPQASVLASLRRVEREQVLREAAAETLNDEEQQVVWLRYAEGLPLARIDEVLGLDGSGARGVLQRCKRKLQKALRQRLEELGHGSSFFRGSLG